MEPGSSRGPADGAGIQVIVADARWRRLIPNAVALVRRAALAAGGADTVVLASDVAVKRLNARHRGRNKPTNVLSFPGRPTGELILASGVVRREADEAKRQPAHHLTHLVVHGCLHLAGRDHHRAGDARRMEMEEARILYRLRVPNPWRGNR
jgi:probable rRNA maturation factor